MPYDFDVLVVGAGYAGAVCARALAEKGWPIMGMEPIGMELEDIFLKLIQAKEGKK